MAIKTIKKYTYEMPITKFQLAIADNLLKTPNFR
jgi:hypothetical protein